MTLTCRLSLSLVIGSITKLMLDPFQFSPSLVSERRILAVVDEFFDQGGQIGNHYVRKHLWVNLGAVFELLIKPLSNLVQFGFGHFRRGGDILVVFNKQGN